ncbi:fibrinogen C domain-containing protein 1-like isoform X2 [Zeugodacus cucurbitae]|uniref:fibrinogen C domain-containing protein 1-like isoform X2 n=1 Tax=Zeugodacus cucurbitae TaxID=28588 RepID=UPI0023D8FADD|nr:fibrinogen C domain-containing protein 1-like isoform X2 [Zeugodacus cucurbitae]
MSKLQNIYWLSVSLVICCALGKSTASDAGNDVFSTTHLPANCNEATLLAGRKAKSDIYKIQLPPQYGDGAEFYVKCLLDPSGREAWTIIQFRQDDTTEFFRGWQEYKNGFGNLNRNFFIGLDKLHALTASQLHELWIELKDFDNVTKYAKYDSFAIADEYQKYALNILGEYSGTAGDAMLGVHDGAKFSTPDQDNSGNIDNCAKNFKGSWWYGNRACHISNLNGVYLKRVTKTVADGIVWEPWHSLKYVHMAIRPKELRIKNRPEN